MGTITQAMLIQVREAFEQADRNALQSVEKMDDQIDMLHDLIIRYLGRVRMQPLSEQQEDEFVRLLSVVDDLESLADVIETDLVTLARDVLQTEQIKPSETVREMMKELHAQLVEALQAAIAAIEENDPRKAQDVLGIKDTIEQAIELALRHQATRLVPEDTAQLTGIRFEMEVLDKLERIYRLTRRIAKAALPDEVLIERAG